MRPIVFAVSLVLMCLGAPPPDAVAAEEPAVSVSEILQHCYYKPTGADRTFDLLLIVLDAEGDSRTEESYVGWWKDYRGQDDLVSKLILFRRSPLYRQDDTYLRWDYTTTSGKPPEQWVYSIRQQRVRRVAQRDPNRPALGLIAEDLVRPQLDRDTHTLKAAERQGGATVYTLETTPQAGTSSYERIVSRFERRADWSDCSLVRQEFMTLGGKSAKQIEYTWQRVGDAWAWHVVTIHNQKPRSTIVYRMENLQVNVGLTDDDFSKRRLTRTFVEDKDQKP